MSISRRKLPPLNALRAFEVAGRRSNFRIAAEELGVTQGAVAQQIRMLEEHLGVGLFQRLPRGVALTAQGKSYLSQLTRAFDILGEATGEVLAKNEAVTISVTPTFAAKLLLPKLPDFNQSLPGIDLRTIATEALSDFDRDQVDIAVRLARAPFEEEFEAVLLFRQELVAIGSPHLLEGRSLPLRDEEILEFPILHDGHDHWATYFGENRKLSGVAFNQTTLALDAALAGQGIAIACRAFVQADLEAGHLVIVSEMDEVDRPDYYLVRKKSVSPTKTASAVWAWCIDRFATK